jgi:hypothetical protein
VHAAAPLAATAAAVQLLDFLLLRPPAQLSYPHYAVHLRYVAAFWLIALQAAECSPVASLLLARLAAVLQRAEHAVLDNQQHVVGSLKLSVADMLLAALTRRPSFPSVSSHATLCFPAHPQTQAAHVPTNLLCMV